MQACRLGTTCLVRAALVPFILYLRLRNVQFSFPFSFVCASRPRTVPPFSPSSPFSVVQLSLISILLELISALPSRATRVESPAAGLLLVGEGLCYCAEKQQHSGTITKPSEFEASQ